MDDGAIALMARGPATTEARSEIAALRERLHRLASALESLDEEQLAVLHELTAMLERLTALLDDPPNH
jgi:hypothetical protein